MSPANAYSLVRPNKSLALRLVTRLAPEYLELLREAQRANGWQRVAPGIADLRRRLNIDGYVALYDSESISTAAWSRGVLRLQGMKALDADVRRLKPSELQDELDALNKVDRHARFATEHLALAAARIDGGHGGNVVHLPTFSLRSEMKRVG